MPHIFKNCLCPSNNSKVYATDKDGKPVKERHVPKGHRGPLAEDNAKAFAEYIEFKQKNAVHFANDEHVSNHHYFRQFHGSNPIPVASTETPETPTKVAA